MIESNRRSPETEPELSVISLAELRELEHDRITCRLRLPAFVDERKIIFNLPHMLRLMDLGGLQHIEIINQKSRSDQQGIGAVSAQGEAVMTDTAQPKKLTLQQISCH